MTTTYTYETPNPEDVARAIAHVNAIETSPSNTYVAIEVGEYGPDIVTAYPFLERIEKVLKWAFSDPAASGADNIVIIVKTCKSGKVDKRYKPLAYHIHHEQDNADEPTDATRDAPEMVECACCGEHHDPRNVGRRASAKASMRTVYFDYHTHRYGSSGITSHSMTRTIAVLRAMDEKPKSQWVAIIQKDRRGWLETFGVIEASPSLDEVKSALEERFKDLGEQTRIIEVAIIKTGPRGGLDRKERVVFFSAQNWTLSDF